MNILYRIGWLSSKLLGHVLWRYSGRGLEHLPQKGGFFLCSNHCSNLDPPLLGSFLSRDIGYLAKRELFDKFLFGAVLRRVNAIPIKRGAIDRAATAEVMRRLASGLPVVVFPEGTRTRTGRPGPPKRGAGKLIADAGVPVVPVHIRGTFQWWRSLLRWRGITFTFGPPLSKSEIAAFGNDRDAYERIAVEVMRRIAQLNPNESRAE